MQESKVRARSVLALMAALLVAFVAAFADRAGARLLRARAGRADRDPDLAAGARVRGRRVRPAAVPRSRSSRSACSAEAPPCSGRDADRTAAAAAAPRARPRRWRQRSSPCRRRPRHPPRRPRRGGVGPSRPRRRSRDSASTAAPRPARPPSSARPGSSPGAVQSGIGHEQRLDRVELGLLALRDERDRLAVAADAAGAADAVHVHLGLVGQVVVDDVRDLRDVEAARGDVGRHEQPARGRPRNAIITESRAPWLMSPCSARTRWPRRRGRRRARWQPIFVRAKMMAHAGSRPRAALDGVELAARLHLEHALLDALDGDLLGRHADGLGRCSSSAASLRISARHGGGEERRLAAPRRAPEDRADVVDEAHRQHLVGLVEHDHARVGEHQLAARAAGRARGPACRRRPGAPRASRSICSRIGAPP